MTENPVKRFQSCTELTSKIKVPFHVINTFIKILNLIFLKNGMFNIRNKKGV